MLSITWIIFFLFDISTQCIISWSITCSKMVSFRSRYRFEQQQSLITSPTIYGRCPVPRIKHNSSEKRGGRRVEPCALNSFVARRYDKNSIDMRCAACVVLFVWCIFSGESETRLGKGKNEWVDGGRGDSQRAPMNRKGGRGDNGKRRKQEFRWLIDASRLKTASMSVHANEFHVRIRATEVHVVDLVGRGRFIIAFEVTFASIPIT